MLAGTYSIEFEVSIWLYILTFFASLFIILIKRFAESKKNLDVRYPKVSIFYSLGFMPKIIKLSLFINIFVYLVYCISETLTLVIGALLALVFIDTINYPHKVI